VLFTDGLSDARGSGGDRFGEDRVLDVALLRRTRTPSEVLAGIFEAVAVHTGGLELPDDQTCVVVRS
jgi:serine phosphatase RsbU (regulator of sigma subunit)